MPRIEEELQSLLSVAGVEAQPAVSPDELREMEQESELALPQAVRDLWLTANGVDLGGAWRLLSVEEAIDYGRALGRAGIPAQWGYLPLLDCNDSSPYCIACEPPLSGRVVRVAHDTAQLCTPMTRSSTRSPQRAGRRSWRRVSRSARCPTACCA